MRLKTVILLALLSFCQIIQAEEKMANVTPKREPAQTEYTDDSGIVTTYLKMKPSDSQYPFRLWDPKFKIVCYGVAGTSGSGGSSISCIQK